MVQFWDSIPPQLQEWALTQPLFFTASAPLTGSHVNISPKGLPAATFTIFSPTQAAYIDATGSGSETISHVYENGRVTIMFCSFERSPRILRFFCWGKVVEWDEPDFEGWVGRMAKGKKKKVEGARAVVLLTVWKVQTSCGYGVPLLTLQPPSPPPSSSSSSATELPGSPSTRPTLTDRDTLGHWAHQKIEKNELLAYQAQWNSNSLDGCPGMRAAMRDCGEWVWWELVKARARRVLGGQREAVCWGVVVGVVVARVWVMLMGVIGGVV